GLQKPGDAGDEVIEVGDLCENVVADDEICLASFTGELVGETNAEELGAGGNAFVNGSARYVLGRLDAQHGHSKRQEVLQQVSVVAGKLDDEADNSEAEPVFDHH